MNVNDVQVEIGDVVLDAYGVGRSSRMVVLSIAEIPADQFYIPDTGKTVYEYNAQQATMVNGIEESPPDDPVIGVSFMQKLDHIESRWMDMEPEEVHTMVQERNVHSQRPLIYSFPQSRLEKNGENFFQ